MPVNATLEAPYEIIITIITIFLICAPVLDGEIIQKALFIPVFIAPPVRVLFIGDMSFFVYRYKLHQMVCNFYEQVATYYIVNESVSVNIVYDCHSSFSYPHWLNDL